MEALKAAGWVLILTERDTLRNTEYLVYIFAHSATGRAMKVAIPNDNDADRCLQNARSRRLEDKDIVSANAFRAYGMALELLLKA